MAFELLKQGGLEEPLDEEESLVGQLVEIFGLSGRLRLTHRLASGHAFAQMQPVEASWEHRAEYPEGVDANGLKGRCQAWNEDEQVYSVETFEGFVFDIPAEKLRVFQPPEPEDGGFDAVWPSGEYWYDLFVSNVFEALTRKGYCLVQLFGLDKAFQAEAARTAAAREDYRTLEAELQPAYLGDGEAGAKVANLGEGRMANLEHCDQLFVLMGQLLEQMSLEVLGFESYGRSSTLLRVATQDETAPGVTDTEVNDGIIEGLLHHLRRRKVCMLCVVSGEAGEVAFNPREGLGWTLSRVPLAANQLLLFRHDVMGYSYTPGAGGIAVQSWIYSRPLSVVYEHVEGGDAEERREVIGAHGPTQPTQECPHIRAIAVRLSGAADSDTQEWNMICSGTDGLTRWPEARWDQDVYYEPDEQSALMMQKSYNNHGAFLLDDHLINFDYKFFGYTEDGKAEATGPEQRLMLEVGYECLHSAGRRRADLRGASVGFITATYMCNWLDMSPVYNEYVFTGYTSMQTAACVSQFAGTRGPVTRVDTACSSSLVATATADQDLRMRRGNSVNVVQAVMGQNDPFGWGGLCAMGMLSKKGRCFTFDNSSDGFAKGEGAGAVYLQFEGKKEDRFATVAGSAINQDGRSASMTAPNGPSQREMTRNCFDAAKITPADLSVSEVHGTGTALGDPIEVGALRAAMDGFRCDNNPILITTVKCNLAHMEANAGISGVIKVTSMLRHHGVPSCIHTKSLNPHLQMEGFPWYIITEFVDPVRTDMYIGVQGFGMGGTNARTDFWGRTSEGSKNPSQLPPKQEVADFSSVVPCPRCLGSMCWLCGVAVPKYERDRKKHHCSQVRSGPGMYENAYGFCSTCYTGEYTYGDVVEEIPSLYDVQSRNIRIYAVGTWSAYSTYHQLEETEPGIFVFAVELGETRAEHFHFVLNEEPSMAYYPITKNASQTIRVQGPDDEGQGHHWIIDGKASGSPAGTVFVVTLTWDRASGAKKLHWEAASEPEDYPLRIRTSDYENEYYVLGSWTSFKPLKMRLADKEQRLYTVAVRVGITMREEFRILRDNDEAQCLHPPTPRCHQTSVLAKGPDDLGEGRNWTFSGQVGEEVLLELRVQDGDFSVAACFKSLPRIQWKSAEERHEYFVTGTFNRWGLDRMESDGDTPGVYQLRVPCIYFGAQEFQIIVDSIPSQVLYPASTGASSGTGLLMGPGEGGEGKTWVIDGGYWPDTSIVIELDLNKEDRRKMVQWWLADMPLEG